MAIARETCKQLGIQDLRSPSVTHTFSFPPGMGADPTNPNILTPQHLAEAKRDGNIRLVETVDGFAQVCSSSNCFLAPMLSRSRHPACVG